MDLMHQAVYYKKLDFNWSSLLIATTLPDTAMKFEIIVKCLFSLKYFKKIKKIVDKNPILLKNDQIKLIYYKAGYESDFDSVSGEFHIANQSLNYSVLNKDSILLFYKAIHKKEHLRKRLLIESFLNDNKNLEPLIFLFKESLCSENEILYYSKMIHPSLFPVFNSLFEFQLNIEIFCPLVFLTWSNFVIKGNKAEVFRMASLQLEVFSEDEHLNFLLGLSYIAMKDNQEALKYLKKSIEINKHFGPGYLYSGLAYSYLSDTEATIKNLNTAYSIMQTSELPSYYLGYEYQSINSINKAKYFYKNSLEIIEANIKNEYKNHYLITGPLSSEEGGVASDFSFISEAATRPNDSIFHVAFNIKNNKIYFKIICGYIYCLILFEHYEDAVFYLKRYQVQNILNVFCLLFDGSVPEAKASLELCDKNSVYYALKGFLAHLVDDFTNGIKSYENSLSLKKDEVVEKLYSMAIDNLSGTRPNKAFGYVNYLLETIKYKERMVFSKKD